MADVAGDVFPESVEGRLWVIGMIVILLTVLPSEISAMVTQIGIARYVYKLSSV
jgi:hypothetical protein